MQRLLTFSCGVIRGETVPAEIMEGGLPSTPPRKGRSTAMRWRWWRPVTRAGGDIVKESLSKLAGFDPYSNPDKLTTVLGTMVNQAVMGPPHVTKRHGNSGITPLRGKPCFALGRQRSLLRYQQLPLASCGSRSTRSRSRGCAVE